MASTFQVTQSNTKTIVIRRIIYPHSNDLRGFHVKKSAPPKNRNETLKGIKEKRNKNTTNKKLLKSSSNVATSSKIGIKQNTKRKLLPCDKYEKGNCLNGVLCSYMHQEFPCTLFYLGNKCQDDHCKFLHNEPLPVNILEAFIKYVKKLRLQDLIPNIPELSGTDVESIINRTQIELLRKKYEGVEYETLVNAQNRRPLDETLSFLSQEQLKELKEMGVKNHYEVILLNTWQLNALGIKDGVLYQKIIDACLNVYRHESIEKVVEETNNNVPQCSSSKTQDMAKGSASKTLLQSNESNSNEEALLGNKKLTEISLDDYEALARLPKEVYFRKILERNYYLRNHPLPKEVRIREIEKFRTQLKLLQTELLNMMPVKYNSPKMSQNTMVVVHDLSSSNRIGNLEIELQKFVKQKLDKEFIESLKPKARMKQLKSTPLKESITNSGLETPLKKPQQRKSIRSKRPRNLLNDFKLFSKDYDGISESCGSIEPIKIEKSEHNEEKVNGKVLQPGEVDVGEKFRFTLKKCRIMLTRLKEIKAVPVVKSPTPKKRRAKRRLLYFKRCSKIIKEKQLDSIIDKGLDSSPRRTETFICATPFQPRFNEVQSEKAEIETELIDKMKKEENVLKNQEKSENSAAFFDEETEAKKVYHKRQEKSKDLLSVQDGKEVINRENKLKKKAAFLPIKNEEKTENNKKKNEDKSNVLTVKEKKEAESIIDENDTWLLIKDAKNTLKIKKKNIEENIALSGEEKNEVELIVEKSPKNQDSSLLVKAEQELKITEEKNEETKEATLIEEKNQEKNNDIFQSVEEEEKVPLSRLKAQVQKKEFTLVKKGKENKITIKKDQDKCKSLLSAEKQKDFDVIEQKAQGKNELLWHVQDEKGVELVKEMNEEKNETSSIVEEKSGDEFNSQEASNAKLSVEEKKEFRKVQPEAKKYRFLRIKDRKGDLITKEKYKKKRKSLLSTQVQEEVNLIEEKSELLVRDVKEGELVENMNQQKNETSSNSQEKNEAELISRDSNNTQLSVENKNETELIGEKVQETNETLLPVQESNQAKLISEKKDTLLSIEDKPEENLIRVQTGDKIGVSSIVEDEDEHETAKNKIQQKNKPFVSEKEENNFISDKSIDKRETVAPVQNKKKNNSSIPVESKAKFIEEQTQTLLPIRKCYISLEKCNLKIVQDTFEPKRKNEVKGKPENNIKFNENVQDIENEGMKEYNKRRNSLTNINPSKETTSTNSLESSNSIDVKKEINLKTKNIKQEESEKKSPKSKNIKLKFEKFVSKAKSHLSELKTKNLHQENLDKDSKAVSEKRRSLSLEKCQTDPRKNLMSDSFTEKKQNIFSKTPQNEHQKPTCNTSKESLQELYKRYVKKAEINKVRSVKLDKNLTEFQKDSKEQKINLPITKAQLIKKENAINKSYKPDHRTSNEIKRFNNTIKTEEEICFKKPQKLKPLMKIEELFGKPYKIPKINNPTCSQEPVTSEKFKTNDIGQGSLSSLLKNPFTILNDQLIQKPLYGKRNSIDNWDEENVDALAKTDSWVEINNVDKKNYLQDEKNKFNSNWESLSTSTPVQVKKINTFSSSQEPLRAKTSDYNPVLKQAQKSRITDNDSDFIELGLSDVSSIKSFDDSQVYNTNKTKSRSLTHRYSSGFSSASNTELTQEDLCDWDKEFMDIGSKSKNNKQPAAVERPSNRPSYNLKINPNFRQFSTYTPSIPDERRDHKHFKHSTTPLLHNCKDRCSNYLPWVLKKIDLPHFEVNTPNRLEELIFNKDYEDRRLVKHKHLTLSSTAKSFTQNQNEKNRIILLNKIQSSDWCANLPSHYKDKVIKLILFNLTRALTVYQVKCQQTNSELEFSLNYINNAREIECALDLLNLYVNSRGEVMPKDLMPKTHNIMNPFKREPTYDGYAQPQVFSSTPSYTQNFRENQSNRRRYWSTRQRFANRARPFYRRHYNQHYNQS